jgi:septum formation protein
VMAAEVTELEDPAAEPRATVAHNSALKADWVAVRRPEAIVLGADTTVFIDGTVLNKPRDRTEAREMLRRLSGRTHEVYTGLAVRRGNDGLRFDRGETSEVTFKPVDDEAIENYLNRVDTMDKAGAYSIQESRELIIAAYRGSFTNIMGLPLGATKQILTDCGFAL